MTKRLLHTVIAALLLLGVTAQSANAADAAGPVCDRSCLKGFVDQFIDALVKKDPSGLPVVPTLKYTENGRHLSYAPGQTALGPDRREGIWARSAAPLPYRDYYIDADSGQVAVFTALKEYDGTAVVMIRLKVENRKISEIETIVSRRGDHWIFKPEDLQNLSNIYDQPVPPASRRTRAELIAAADAYFVGMETSGTPQFKQAPFAAGMKRFENGMQTTDVDDASPNSAANQFERGIFKGVIADDRRYPLVDTERGVVLAILAFRPAIPGDGDTNLISESFKISDGKLVEIRAVMVNLSKNASTGWEN